jgi:hypothetical protein
MHGGGEPVRQYCDFRRERRRRVGARRHPSRTTGNGIPRDAR